ncbi:hypothetical protein J2X02_001174 [Pseudoxanthomonas japonensis]|uniref:hypothetical protein n=1 Tax=Pseudoxanthomonas japonensis TaxID=69284 RepID=UPI0028626400|nr:hypothetical protein [Pseudoxanthomonas japonensis]MDR7068357.1 hypothetical protein [Pseudoxanthomonas japonensis]
MSATRPPWQRLVMATAAAMVSLLIASWLVGRVLPAAWQEVVPTRWGFLTPLSYIVTAACMGLGGALAGHRFLIVAVGLTLAVWAATLSVLAGIAGAASDIAYPLGYLLRTNALSATLSVVAAGLGTWLGALWYARRTARR